MSDHATDAPPGPPTLSVLDPRRATDSDTRRRQYLKRLDQVHQTVITVGLVAFLVVGLWIAVGLGRAIWSIPT